MVEQNIPTAMILEDDFDFQEGFKDRLGYLRGRYQSVRLFCT